MRGLLSRAIATLVVCSPAYADVVAKAPIHTFAQHVTDAVNAISAAFNLPTSNP